MITITPFSLLLLAFAASLNAGVISTTGAISQVSAPGSVVIGALESDTVGFLFLERSGILGVDLSVDLTSMGTIDDAGHFTPGTLPAGTMYTSYYLHVDAVGAPPCCIYYAGSVTFDQDIIGVIVTMPLLGAGNWLGAPGTTYPPLPQGLEIPGESLTISGDRRTLTIDWGTAAGVDDIRIITTVAETTVPEPGTLCCRGGGLIGVGILGRRRQSQHAGSITTRN